MKTDPRWQPTPSCVPMTERVAYYAGYSDGFYGYPFGEAYDEKPPTAYRDGYESGQRDEAREYLL